MLQVAAHGAMEIFFAGALQHVVIFEIPTGRFQPTVFSQGCIPIGVAVDIILQFRSRHYLKSCGGGCSDLGFQNGSRRLADRMMVGCIRQITDNQSRSLQPVDNTQGIEVRHEVEITVAFLPVGEFIPSNRLHLHVDGQQISAGMGPAVDRVVQKEIGVHPFAEKTPVEVGKYDLNGVDAPVPDHAGHLFTGQYSRCFGHGRLRKGWRVAFCITQSGGLRQETAASVHTDHPTARVLTCRDRMPYLPQENINKSLRLPF